MVLDTGSFQFTVLVAVILAGAARTIIPFLSKRQSDIAAGLEPRKFTYSYITTALLGVIPVFVGAILLLPIILPQVINTGSQLIVFITSFGIAYATTDLVNRNLPTVGTPTQAIVNRVKKSLIAEKESGKDEAAVKAA